MNTNYVVLSILALLVAIVYVKSGFWAHQPVFHVYDIGYYLSKKAIIPQMGAPLLTRWVDLSAVNTLEWVDMSADQKESVASFLRREFHDDGRGNKMCITVRQLEPYLAEGGLVSWYGSKGVIISRPISLTLGEDMMGAYYCDYLCVAAEYRKQGVAPKLIQTHEYRQRQKTPSTKVSLFKREGESTAWVRPLMRQNVQLTWSKNVDEKAKRLGVDDVRWLYAHLQGLKYDVKAMVSEGTLMALIKSGVWRAYVGEDRGETAQASVFGRYQLPLTNRGEGAQVLSSGRAQLSIYKDTGMEWNGREMVNEFVCEGGGLKEAGWVVSERDIKGEWAEEVEWLMYNGVYEAKSKGLMVQ